MQTLLELLQPHGYAAELNERLARFGDMVLNAGFNLTAARTPEAILPHLLDSLSFYAEIDGPLVDIGSGGGFPAIPLALATGVPIVCIESVGKKAAFLRRVIADLAIDGTVLNGRAERFALEDEYRGRFRYGTARAVAAAPTVIEYVVPFLAHGGRAFLQRGAMDDQERSASADAALVLGGELREERLLDGERRLVIIEKVRPTPWRFPRKNGAPIKQPLCLPREHRA